MGSSANTKHLIAEYVSLFVALPIGLALPVPAWLKLFAGALVVVYVLFVAHRMKILNYRGFLPDSRPKRGFWVRLTLFLFLSILLMAVLRPDEIFLPVRTDPGLWVGILFIYTLLSVLPQEWIYRYFYHKRYPFALMRGWSGILINGLVFSLAHLFLMNSLVLLITFIGGCIFYWAYLNSKSLFLVCLEHAFYGLWLFTIGAGKMLAFPV